MAIALSEVRGLIAFALILIALLIKSRPEETLLRRNFSDYDSYAAANAALVRCLT